MTTVRTEAQKQMLHRVANRIENDPDLYDQEQWIATEDGTGRLGLFTEDNELADPFDCGARACIAGWAVLENFIDRFHSIKLALGVKPVVERYHLAKAIPEDHDMPKAGRELLGLDIDEADVLFGEYWEPADIEEGDDHITFAKKTAQALRDIANGASVTEVTMTNDDEGEGGPDGSDYS